MWLRREELRRWTLLPVIVTFLLLVLTLSFGYQVDGDLAALIWSRPETGWSTPLWYLYFAFFSLSFFLAMFLTLFLSLGTLVSPFMTGLSRQVEVDWLGPLKEKAVGWRDFLPGFPSLLGYALRRLIRFFGLSLPIMLLALIPLVGPPLAFVGEFALTALFVAMTFMDLPLSRRAFDRRDRARFLFQNLAMVLGLGLALSFLLLLPFVDLLVVPLGVMAGSLVVLVREQAGRTPKKAPELN